MRSVKLISIIMTLYVVIFSNAMAFGKQKHLGAAEVI